MTAEGELVRLDGVTCAYGRRRVLTGVDLVVGTDDFVGVVGPSGSGKTTLLRVVAGLLRPSSGTVVRPRGLRVGYVPQVETVDWAFPVTVAECVLMARTHRRTLPWPTRAERREVHDVLDRLGIGALGGRHIRDLSGGQQQRVFLARTLLGRPHLVLLDEPTSGIDVRTRHEVLHLLDDLHRDGLAVVLTTHDLNGLAAHLPQLVCLNGEVVGRGPPRQVLCAPVLERTFGARMEVLEHAGMPVVLDPRALAGHRHGHARADRGTGHGDATGRDRPAPGHHERTA